MSLVGRIRSAISQASANACDDYRLSSIEARVLKKYDQQNYVQPRCTVEVAQSRLRVPRH